MWGLSGNLSDLTMTSSQYDILLCSETLVDRYFIWSLSLVRGCLYMCKMDMYCGCSKMLKCVVFMLCKAVEESYTVTVRPIHTLCKALTLPYIG